MKPKIIIALSSLLLLFFVSACKKKAGPGGKNTISGTVLFKNGVSGTNEVAANATVSVAYGTSEATAAFDKTLLTDASGKYSIEGLQKGNYFIRAAYIDSHGFNYTTSGYGITLENKKNNLELNMTLE